MDTFYKKELLQVTLKDKLLFQEVLGMSKYEPLWRYLKENKKDSYKLSYEEIKNILGFDIDHSFLTYKKESKEYGYEVGKISMKEKTVMFNKM